MNIQKETHAVYVPVAQVCAGRIRWFHVAALAFWLAGDLLTAQEPDTNSDAKAISGSVTNTTEQAPTAVEDVDNAVVGESTEAKTQPPRRRHASGIERAPMVVFMHDAVLRSNDSAEAVVVIGGSAKIHGKVKDAVVAIGGDIEMDGEARDLVAVLGGVSVGKGAKVHGEVVSVGGALDAAEGVQFNRKPVELDLGGLSIGLRKWMIHCLFKLRPLAPQVGWVWMIAGFFFLIYLAVALLLPGAVRACAGELTRRPATTFFMGLLTKMLMPIIFLILAATGIGAVVIPFIVAPLGIGAIIGKTALFEALGSGIGKRFGAAMLQNSLIAFLLGILVITVIYLVPVIGLLAFGVVSLWGLGGAVTAAFGSLKREAPARPNPTPTTGNTRGGSAPMSAETPEGATASAASSAQTVLPANLPESLSHRRANFWERMGAGLLDFVLIGVVGGLLHARGTLVFPMALAYFTVMWTWRGATVGGAVLGLKVVRQDGEPVTFLVSLVRALGAAFSIIVFFLGFLWIGWDREKQGWHDKIAGTVVVRLSRSMPLVCL